MSAFYASFAEERRMLFRDFLLALILSDYGVTPDTISIFFDRRQS
jgi:hypothetical protein